ncbi:MAG: DUF1850 domain-containing protein [Natronomonas sp.]
MIGRILVALLFGAVVFGAAVAAVQQPTLVAATDSGDELFVTPVEDGDELILEYTHSVEQTTVRDVYVVDGDELVTDRTEFKSFGAGLPTESVHRDGDWYIHEPPDQRHETVIVSTGSVAEQQLVVGEQRYNLTDRSDGGRVVLRIETRTNPSIASVTPSKAGQLPATEIAG